MKAKLKIYRQVLRLFLDLIFGNHQRSIIKLSVQTMLNNNTDHEKLIEAIEKKMIGDALLKSQQQKKNELFDYQNYQSEFNDLSGYNPGKQTKIVILDESNARKNLKEIYMFYCKAYIQLKQKYRDFEQFNDNKINFQGFLLFCKSFKLLKLIFPLQKLKISFKKFANFGKYLTFDNFLFLLNSLSHEVEAKNFFNIGVQISGLDIQSVEQLQKQQLYSYMNLGAPELYRRNFNTFFQAFNCKQKPSGEIKDYNYRKFSLPELKQRALANSVNSHIRKSSKLLHQKYLFSDKNDKAVIPKSETGSLLVSWQGLKKIRSKSQASLKKSQDLISKKYIKYDADDDIYLQEFQRDARGVRAQIQKKIRQIQQIEENKNRILLQKFTRKS